MAYAATPAAQPAPAEPFEEGKAPPVIDSHGGKLTPVTHGGLDFLSVILAGVLLTSPISALLYGAAYAARPPSIFRTVIRTLPLAIPAIVILIFAVSSLTESSAQLGMLWGLLGLAFALFATGDALLATESPSRRSPALSAVLLAHLCLTGVCAIAARNREIGLIGLLGAGLVLVVAIGVSIWLRHGSRKTPGLVIAVWITATIMTLLAMTQLQHNTFWSVGALLLYGSDSVILAKLVKDPAKLPSNRITGWLSWFVYCAAHVAFLIGMIRFFDPYLSPIS